MELSPCEYKESTFHRELQICNTIDTRDTRGKRHDMSVVLVGVVIALLSKQDGNLSSIHRHMSHHYAKTVAHLGVPAYKVVSRAQLPLILSKVNLAGLESLIFKHYGISLDDTVKSWFSVDGKELRGSIQTGDSRGEAIVTSVKHDTGEILSEAFYNGQKESEKPCVKEILRQSGLLKQKISLDALHFNPDILNSIENEGGVYLIGLKGNQRKLRDDMRQMVQKQPISYTKITKDKKHGRTETRIYQVYDVSKQDFDTRWKDSVMKTLIKIKRHFIENKTKKISEETAFYMSNLVPENQKEANNLCDAVRNHWSVETVNHVRDVTLKEDEFRTKKKESSQTMASLRTLIHNILKKNRVKNLAAKLDNFSYDFDELIKWLVAANFL
jgi:predicted transposase YbfD/YdcC